MNSFFLYNETYTNGFSIEILDIISFISVLCAIFVIILKNPIVSVLSLIALFFSIATYLILLGLNFIGLSYLLVYVGAVSILFLFILMLINVKISELSSNTNNSIPLAILVSILFNYLIPQVLPENIATANNSFNMQEISKMFFRNKEDVCYTTGMIWDNNLSESSHITTIGNIMYSSNSI
jgi:NADH-ubiquinone oxidoreductase chain 6